MMPMHIPSKSPLSGPENALLGKMIGTPATRVSDSSALRDAMDKNQSYINELATRLGVLADRIVGPEPESDAEQGAEIRASDGFLRTMRSLAEEQHSGLQRISDALRRIEREFDV